TVVTGPTARWEVKHFSNPSPTVFSQRQDSPADGSGGEMTEPEGQILLEKNARKADEFGNVHTVCCAVSLAQT
ncbi:unnamed protein product, partial [Mycena citricolor]